MEVDNLIEFSSVESGDAGETAVRNDDSSIDAAAAAGDSTARPLQRRLLLKVGDSRIVPSSVSPKRPVLQSLGDDASILDAILGNILHSDTSFANGSENSDSTENSASAIVSSASDTLSVSNSFPSAPPMETDWHGPGPSGCRRYNDRSSSSSSIYSSTLSLSKLDLSIVEPTSTPILDALRRGGARSTIIGGVPFGRRTCRCSGDPTEVTCSQEHCRSLSSTFRRPRSADGLRIPIVDDAPVASPHSDPRLDPSKRIANPRLESAEESSPESSSVVIASAPSPPPSPVQRTSPVVRQQSSGETRQQRCTRRQGTTVTASRTRRTTASSAEATTTRNSPATVVNVEGEMEGRGFSQLGQWPHSFSNSLACLACTLGIFNISRFAILSIQFGANFIIQFVVMSVVMGIPLFTFHVALGQLLGTGTMDMWKISPIFQGIGVALIMSQALLGIYSIVGVSWMLVYFRDSFITTHDTYRWAEPYLGFMGGSTWRFNSSYRLEETVGDYFSGVVLQRHNVENPSSSPGTLKFQLTFNLAVVWMIVFIALSKGLKSYGKVVFLFSLVPILGMVFLCVKIMGLAPSYRKSSINIPQTDWSEFFLNSKSWSVAMTEAFYTWGLLGASAMQMASHNRPHHLLYKDTNIVTIVTFAVLILSAFLANTCSQLLLAHGYQYMPSSFEKAATYGFLKPLRWTPIGANAQPVKWMTHNLYLAGDRIVKPGTNTRQQSGYQALRFATELMPATLAVLGSEQLSPFWSVVFYFIFILFGIAQQLAIMHSIITGIMAIKIKTMKSWETTITFFACVCGFILGLPMATEFGIFVMYFMDFCVGGAWWIVLLYLIELMAVFMVRGRPYSGETVVAELFKKAGTSLKNFAAPLLSFTWNVILPVFLMIQTVNVFKSGNYRDLFKWGAPMLYDYWPAWSRTFGSMLQIIPLLTIPFVAVVQTCRYLSKGPSDLFERIQLLYRPPEDALLPQANPESTHEHTEVEVTNESAPPPDSPPEDPPPKYTPPPSYSTATGARIAKMLRQSFRRSFRRLANPRGESSGEASNSRSSDVVPAEARPSPPDYATVLVEINRTPTTSTSETNVGQPPPDVVPQTSSAFSQMSSLVRNSFRRAMRSADQSTSSERLVDSDGVGINNRAYIIPRLTDNDKPNGNM